MKKMTLIVSLITVHLVISSLGYAADGAGESTVGFTVHLHDGSRIRGAVNLDSLHLTSPAVGEIEVPMSKVRMIIFRDGQKAPRVFLTNGDRLTGTLAISELEIETLFGNIAIPLKVVASLRRSALNNLIAHYSFNGNANDSSGNEINGTINGARPCEDRHGNKDSGFLFDGVDDYIKFGKSLPDMKEMTICAWVFAENDVPFLSDGDWALGNDVTIQAGPGFVIVRADKGGHQLYDKLDVGVELHQRWRHIAWTMTSKQSNIYIDGSHRAGVKRSGSNVGFHNFMLGTMEYPEGSVGWLGYWKGRISSLRIYSRILSCEEIREISDLDD